MKTTKAERDELRALEAKATPAPWRWGDWSAPFGTPEQDCDTLEGWGFAPDRIPSQAGVRDGVIRYREDTPEYILAVENMSARTDDQLLIAAMRNKLLALLDDADRSGDE